MACWIDALNADKVYDAMREDFIKTNKDRDKLLSKIRPLIRDITTLDVMDDIMIRKMGDAETTNKAQDKTLEQITGVDGESWWWKYSHSTDLIRDMIIAKCVEVANIKATLDAVLEQRSALDAEMDDYRDKFRNKFNKEAAKDEA